MKQWINILQVENLSFQQKIYSLKKIPGKVNNSVKNTYLVNAKLFCTFNKM